MGSGSEVTDVDSGENNLLASLGSCLTCLFHE